MKIIGALMIIIGILFLSAIFYPEILFNKDVIRDVGIFILPLSFFTMLFGLLSIIMGVGVVFDWYKK